ncbi:MAG: RecT family recombinase [Methylococcaceae bacterium]|jgi:hypothetical protein
MSTELTTQDGNGIATTDTNSVIFNPAAMQQLSAVANLMATSKITIPVHLRGNSGDCFAIALQASQWRMNPFAVAQKTHITPNGALGYEAQLISAVISANAPVTGAPEYEYIGDWDKILGKVEERKSEKGGKYYVATYTKSDEHGLGIICRMTLNNESAPREMKVMMSQCYPRFSTQWATDPKMQISYVAIRKWSRMFAPGVILGVYAPDELESELPEKEINPLPVSDKKTEAVLEKLNKKKQPIEHESVTTLIDVRAAINSATGRESLDHAKALMFKLAGDNRAIADVEYREKVAQLKQQYETAQKQKTEINWDAAIRECGDDTTLQALLNDMPEALQLEYSELIDAQFDLLG